MKLQIAATILSASSAAAFMVAPNANINNAARSTMNLNTDNNVGESSTTATTAAAPIFDPLGLYPESSEEFQQGRVSRQLEPSLQVQRPVVDPMGLYPSDSPAYLESVSAERRQIVTDSPIYDPMGLYPAGSEERQEGAIQPMEPDFASANNNKDINDPLGLYPKDSAAYKTALTLEEESLVSKNRQLYDPLGLYPSSAEEWQKGQIRAMEPRIKAIKPILDPLNMYQASGQADQVDYDVLMSEALPFLPRPAVLDGELVGDYGFDPLGFAKSKDDLAFMRQAELKHSRIAMLAAAGWPLSELFDKKFASLLHMKPLLVEGDRVPSLLNGGLSHVNPFYWGGILAVAGFVEVLGMMNAKDGWSVAVNEDGRPGFDPLGLFPEDAAGQERIELAEIKNGRTAMLAITAFAVIEALTKTAVVDASPFFFHPPF